MQVMLLGLPGAGKGTQAQRIAARFSIPHISTGDMFRAAIASQSALGREVQPYLDSGKLVPDDLTIRVMKERLGRADAVSGFLLDGFPRTLPQARALDEMLAEINRPLSQVIYIRVPREVLLARLTGRRVCRSCSAVYHVLFQPPRRDGECDVCGGELYQRSDDTEEAVGTRLEQYAATEPLVDYYKERGLLCDVDGERSVDDVWDDISRLLSNRKD